MTLKRAARAIPHARLGSCAGADYLAVMSRAVFQAGLSWAAIDAQWAALCEAFDGFDPNRIARYGDDDVRRIMAHPGILHSERKIRAAIKNAQTLLDLTKVHGKFRNYLRSFGSYAALVDDLKRRFAYVGDISAYYFLFRVDEPVPPFATWIKSVEGEHPRIKEMVARRST